MLREQGGSVLDHGVLIINELPQLQKSLGESESDSKSVVEEKPDLNEGPKIDIFAKGNEIEKDFITLNNKYCLTDDSIAEMTQAIKPIEFTGLEDLDYAKIVGYTASHDAENPQPEPQASNDTILDD